MQLRAHRGCEHVVECFRRFDALRPSPSALFQVLVHSSDFWNGELARGKRAHHDESPFLGDPILISGCGIIVDFLQILSGFAQSPLPAQDMAAGAARREVASEESKHSMGSPVDSDRDQQRETPPLFNCRFRMGPRFEINDHQMVSVFLLDRWTRKPKDSKMMGPAWAPVSVMLRWVHGAFCGTTVGFRAKIISLSLSLRSWAVHPCLAWLQPRQCQHPGLFSVVQSRPFNFPVFAFVVHS